MTEEKIRTFWVDLETPPDVLFFEPIVRRLQAQHHIVHVTCRDFSDVPELADLYGIGGTTVGRHGGKSKPRKILAGLSRSAALAAWARAKRIDLAIGFGSRPLVMASALLRIPSVAVFDYEHAKKGKVGINLTSWTFVPEEIPDGHLQEMRIPRERLIRYSGLKEEVYTGVYQHRPGLLRELGLDDRRIIVLFRPPATMATYHEALSDVICRRVLERIADNPAVLAIFLRRDGDSTFDDFLGSENIRRLTVPVKGLDLITESDLVISGGGTMVREAVALGVPAYSIFAGKKGAVDDRLDREGRLVLIRNVDDIARICFIRRPREGGGHRPNDSVLRFFVREFVRLAGGGADA